MLLATKRYILASHAPATHLHPRQLLRHTYKHHCEGKTADFGKMENGKTQWIKGSFTLFQWIAKAVSYPNKDLFEWFSDPPAVIQKRGLINHTSLSN